MISVFFGFGGAWAPGGVPWWAAIIPIVIVLLLAWFINKDND
jgi:hypothetical protein